MNIPSGIEVEIETLAMICPDCLGQSQECATCDGFGIVKFSDLVDFN